MTKLKAGPNSICEWTQELQKLGYVEIESRGYKKSNAYHITIPKELIINCATETITQEPSVLSKNGFCATENVNSALFKTSTEPNSVEPNKRTKRQRVFIQEYGREMSSDEISAGCVVKEGLLYEADGETRRDYSSKTYRGM